MNEARPPLGLRERNKLDKQRRIRDAAHALFAERGFAATTIDQIAKAAGVAKGTVFLYAKDKHDLLFSVFEDGIRAAFESAFASLPAAPLAEQLAYVFGTFFDFYGQHPGLSKIIVREVVFAEGDKGERNLRMTLEFFGRLAALLQQHIAAGTLRPDLDVFMAAGHAFSLYGFILFDWLQGEQPDPIIARERLRQSYQLMIDGFASRS